jgi:hypothetical protein
MNRFILAAALCAALLPAAHAAPDTARTAVAGESLDSGLGALPHYRFWADRSGQRVIVGQKIDSGLGDLPHYRYWADATGKLPVAVAPSADSSQVATLK